MPYINLMINFLVDSDSLHFYRVKIDDRSTTTAKMTPSTSVPLEDEDSVIFLDAEPPQEGGIMFSPVMTEAGRNILIENKEK